MRPVRRSYHPNIAGGLYLVSTVFIGMGAVSSQNNLLFAAFGLAIGAILVSGVVSGMALMSLAAEREEPVRAVVGQALVIRYRISNRGRIMPAFALRVRECDSRRSIFARLRRAPSKRQLYEQMDGFAVHVGRRDATSVESVVRALRRGESPLESFRIESSFPFGLLRKSVTFQRRATLLIRPRSIQIGQAVVTEALAHCELDSSVRPQVGRGREYLGLREYAPGDSARKIAWRASARVGQLVVRENMTQTPARLWVGLDLLPGQEPDEEDANERAISVAAGLIENAASQGADVGLVAPAVVLLRSPGSTGSVGIGALERRIGPLLDELARLDLTSVGQDAAPPLAQSFAGASLIVVQAGLTTTGDWPAHAQRVVASEAKERNQDDRDVLSFASEQPTSRSEESQRSVAS